MFPNFSGATVSFFVTALIYTFRDHRSAGERLTLPGPVFGLRATDAGPGPASLPLGLPDPGRADGGIRPPGPARGLPGLAMKVSSESSER